MKEAKTPLPATGGHRVREIAAAYADAAEAIPFGPYMDQEIGGGDLFHLAPSVCLKFRGLERTRATLKKATEAALTSYTASEKTTSDELSDPHFVFAFCYVASNLGLGLISEEEASRVLEFIETHRKQLDNLIDSPPR